MKRQLVISAEARRDLLRIRDYIADDNPDRAETYVEELLARCIAIADFPLAAPETLRRKGWRVVPYGFYMIFYTVTERRVRIRAVKHSATLQ
ncbi:type II toxin-antitoxin system RelE/ParE family toxin [Caulobacter segnis]|uniref:type II toxin-antitoxin system RelE/ParE family toxin n=1 Tax=Caulobacter segnis TaxID=88688 RepID=UPI001CBC7E13|nr:type II toxin-antitoxin system RelE/ParE family toxin [Caulobacter segnis]UAL11405.1 type II toxin-antitoxin system RelE/ParE family toxin [Caulobacter segnis]